MTSTKGLVLCLVALLPVAIVAINNPRLWVGTGSDVIQDEFLITLKSRASHRVAEAVVSQVKSLGFGARVIRQHTVGNRRFLHIHANPSVVHGLLGNHHVAKIESNTIFHMDRPVEEGPGMEMEVPQHRQKREVKDRNNPKCHYDYPGSMGWGIIRTSHRELPDYDTAPYIWGDMDDGEGVDAYIIDSGIRLNHTDFEGRAIWGKTGYGTVAGEPDDDLNGHGTHCAGTVGGWRFGIAKKVTLIACKLLNQAGSGAVSDTIVMMEYIVNRMNEQRAQGKVPRAVSNQSYGGGASNGSYAREAAMQEAADAGLVGATSAGNNNYDSCRNSPTRVSSLFSVSSTDRNDSVSSFSNWGPCADIMAPGRSIWAAGISSTTQYVSKSGTSMASPHVAGIAARFMSSLTEDEAAKMTSQKARALITKSTSRGKVAYRQDRNQIGGGPNHLLYRECGNVDQAEPTPKPTTRPKPDPTTTKSSTQAPQPTPTQPPVAEKDEGITGDDVGPLTTGLLGVSAGLVGASFGMMAMMHVAYDKLK